MAGGGGAWKVAYADFVTAMMAFFLVMWIVAQNKDAKEAVSAYFRDPFGDSSRPSGTGYLEGSELKVKPPPQTKLKGGAKVPILKMIHDRQGTPIGSFVQFSDDRSELDAPARQRLNDLIPLLAGKQNKIEVRGHTSRRRPDADGTMLDPWKLSYDRCMATMAYLLDKGIDVSRIRLSQAGPYEPSVGPENAGWKFRNSRVEIIMLNEYIDDFVVTKKRADEEGAEANDEPSDTTVDETNTGDKKPAADAHGKH
jgi:chemotaxis protein MotB